MSDYCVGFEFTDERGQLDFQRFDARNLTIGMAQKDDPVNAQISCRLPRLLFPFFSNEQW